MFDDDDEDAKVGGDYDRDGDAGYCGDDHDDNALC